jgi:hypothetical protein
LTELSRNGIERRDETAVKGGPDQAKNAVVNELRFSYVLKPIRPFGRNGGHAADWIIENS